MTYGRMSDDLWRVTPFARKLSHGGRVMDPLPKDWSQELRTVLVLSKKSQTSPSSEPHSVCTCAYMHKRGYATLGIKRTMTDCVLYTLYYNFSMIYLKRKKKGTCESKCNAPFSLHFLQISVL